MPIGGKDSPPSGPEPHESQKHSDNHQDGSDKSSQHMHDSVDKSSREHHNKLDKQEKDPEKRLTRKTAGRGHFGECAIADVKMCGKNKDTAVTLKNGLPEKVQTHTQNWERDGKHPQVWHVQEGNHKFDLKADLRLKGNDVTASVKYENGREVSYKNGEANQIKHPNGEVWNRDAKNPGSWDVTSPNKDDPAHPHQHKIHDVNINIANGDIKWHVDQDKAHVREIDSHGKYHDSKENKDHVKGHSDHANDHAKDQAKEQAKEHTRALDTNAQNKDTTSVESSYRKGVTDQAKCINRFHDKADYDTLTHFNDTNCHAATQRKMGLEPTAAGATQMNEGFMKEHGYHKVAINSTEQLKEGDVVATALEQKVFGIQLRIGEGYFNHSGVAERDPESGKMMITEKLGPSSNYVRQSPEAFAQTWTPEGGFAKNQDIWVYRKDNAAAHVEQPHQQPKIESMVKIERAGESSHPRVVEFAKQSVDKVSEHSMHIPSFDSADQHGGHVERGSLLSRLTPAAAESHAEPAKHASISGALLHRLKESSSHSQSTEKPTSHPAPQELSLKHRQHVSDGHKAGADPEQQKSQEEQPRKSSNAKHSPAEQKSSNDSGYTRSSSGAFEIGANQSGTHDNQFNLNARAAEYKSAYSGGAGSYDSAPPLKAEVSDHGSGRNFQLNDQASELSWQRWHKTMEQNVANRLSRLPIGTQVDISFSVGHDGNVHGHVVNPGTLNQAQAKWVEGQLNYHRQPPAGVPHDGEHTVAWHYAITGGKGHQFTQDFRQVVSNGQTLNMGYVGKGFGQNRAAKVTQVATYAPYNRSGGN